MADTAALRRHLEAFIAARQAEIQDAEADLKAIDRVERIEAEYAVKSVTPRPVPPAPVIPEPDQSEKPTVINIVKRIAVESPLSEWTTGSMTPLVHQRGRPDAKPENVSISMVRLAEIGVLRKVRKDPKLGNIYVIG